MNTIPTPEQHQHQWIQDRRLADPISTYACRDCAEQVRGCNTCDEPLATSMATCERCIERARHVIEDIVHDLDTVPFHAAEIMGLRAIRYDGVRVTTSDDRSRLPFGLDRVVEDPEQVAQRIEAAKYPATAVDVLVGWASTWADVLGKTVGGSWSGFLIEHTVWAAQNPDTSGWFDYLGEARRVRATIRRLLGINPERQPAPCVHCGGRIVQEWTPRGLDDQLRCTGCALTWRDRSWLQYANLHTVHELPTTHPDALVSLEEARRIFPTLKRNTLNQWVARHILTPALDVQGRQQRDVRGTLLYRIGDIAERAGAVATVAS